VSPGASTLKKFIYNCSCSFHHSSPSPSGYILPGSRCGLVELAFSSFVLSSRFLRAVVSFFLLLSRRCIISHHLGGHIVAVASSSSSLSFPFRRFVVLWVDFSVSVAICPLSLALDFDVVWSHSSTSRQRTRSTSRHNGTKVMAR